MKKKQSTIACAEPTPDILGKIDEQEYHDKYFLPHVTMLTNVAMKLCFYREEDAEDLVQQVYLKSAVKRGTFQGKAKFSSWLTRIMINERYMGARKGYVNRRHHMADFDAVARQIPTAERDPLQQTVNNELSEKLDRAVESLPESLRMVFIMRKVDDLSTEDTAKVLKLSVPAVKSRLRHATIKLKASLGSG